MKETKVVETWASTVDVVFHVIMEQKPFLN
jgi:hypothetical protein